MDLAEMTRRILLKNASQTGGVLTGGMPIGGKKTRRKMCMCPPMMAGARTKGAKDKKPRKKRAPKRKVAPAVRNWINTVKAYSAQTGMSYKDSLKALKGTRQ
jgi:hypothetical protein